MKKKITAFLLLMTMLALLFSVTAYADTGPKPSVQITFENMGDEVCYGTLLSKYESTGPAVVWDGDEGHIATNGLDREIFQAFVDYKDTDGFYFLQWGWQCNETKKLQWGYYPPNPFKILLYYPDTGTYFVSGIYEKYAFDSYFTVDMKGENGGLTSEDTVLSAQKSYDYSGEIVSFVCRVVITILLEIGIALLFGFRQKRQLLLIGGVNIVTQVGLNIALNLTNFYQGSFDLVLTYLILEPIVFLAEAVVYALVLDKVSDKPVKVSRAIVYAVTANAASFAIGLAIAELIPEIF